MFHGSSETTLNYCMAVLGILLYFYKILPACQECCSCCLCKACSSLGQNRGNERAITVEKNYLDMPFEKNMASRKLNSFPDAFIGKAEILHSGSSGIGE